MATGRIPADAISAEPRPTGWLWKLSLGVAFGVVVVVNVAFVVVAVRTADEISPSYLEEGR